MSSSPSKEMAILKIDVVGRAYAVYRLSKQIPLFIAKMKV